MANEINTRVITSASKNGATVTNSPTWRQDMTGAEMLQNTQMIGTSAELILFGEITGAPSQVLIQNLDLANYVEIGGDSGLTVFKLIIPAGRCCLISPTSATLYAKANTSPVRLFITAFEA